MNIPAKKLIVFVIDDDEAFCQSLSWLLDSVGIAVTAFNSAEKFLQQFDPMQRGCLLIDIRMRGMSGLELQDQLIARKNRMPIIMISGHGDIPMAVRAMKAGAMNFITKPFNDQELLEVIQKALSHVDSKENNLSIVYAQRFDSLTKREKEIMSFVVDGKLNKQIAYDLGISMKTVELHRSRVMQKMQVKSLAELVKAHVLIHPANVL